VSGVVGTVYLLHFDTPFGHAKHYTGSAVCSVELRLPGLSTGAGARN
jgi:hypothetical protein